MIEQAGFEVFPHKISTDKGAVLIDISPTTPQEVEAFNEITKWDFEENYFPREYHNLLFSREKEAISKGLETALDPTFEVAQHKKQIEDYTRYKQPRTGDETHQEFSLEKLARETFLALADGTNTVPNFSKQILYNWDWEAYKKEQPKLFPNA